MKTILLLTLIFSFGSCTSRSVKKEVYSEMDQTQPSKSIKMAMKESEKTIRNSKKLTEDQKDKLIKLKKDTFAQVQKHIGDITKLKKILFKNFAQKEYNESKVDYIVKKISKINKQKMDLMFASLKKAKKILKSTNDAELSKAVFMWEDRFQ